MSAAKTSEQTANAGIARFVPIAGWLPKYDRSWFRPDLIAGLTVAALVVPKSLGYAGIAGVPIQQGLYAAAAGAILYAIFGTSRQSATGPSSALAAVAASAVLAAGMSGGDDAVTLVASVTLVSGLLFLLLALFKMGWISNFSPRRSSPVSCLARPLRWSSANCQRSPARQPKVPTPGRSSSAGWGPYLTPTGRR